MTAPASSPAEQNDETERERIADVLTSYDVGPGMQRLNRPTALSLADAILAAGFRRSSPAATTREWGYEYPLGGGVAVAGDLSEKSARFYSEASPDRKLVNRTPAGPWLPVPKGDE